MTGEFLHIWRQVLAGETSNFQGKHLKVEGARVYYPATQQPYPPLYLGGSSPAAMEIAAEHVDFYLTWGEPPAQVAEKIARVRALAEKKGRTVRFESGRTSSCATAEEAWSAANDLVKYIDKETVERAQKGLAKFDSRDRSEWPRSSGTASTIWRSAPIFGRALAWCEVAQELHWWETRPPLRSACSNTPISASRVSSCPATRIWKRHTASQNCCFRYCLLKSRCPMRRRILCAELKTSSVTNFVRYGSWFLPH